MFRQYDFKILREISIIDLRGSYKVPIISSRCQVYISPSAIYQIRFNNLTCVGFYINDKWNFTYSGIIFMCICDRSNDNICIICVIYSA